MRDHADLVVMDCPPLLAVSDAWAIADQVDGIVLVVAQGTRVVAERNPYYFKVDPSGNQLPYIDRILYDNPKRLYAL